MSFVIFCLPYRSDNSVSNSNTMKNTLLFSVLFSFLSFFGSAQKNNPLIFELELPLKFSIGNQTRENIEVVPGYSVNIPKNDVYRNPVFGLNATMLYSVNKLFMVGIGGGVNGEFYERHPIVNGESYNRLIVPFFVKLRHQRVVGQHTILLLDLNAGYQLYKNGYLASEYGYTFEDTGGIMAGAEIGIGRAIGENTVLCKVGYELNQYHHTFHLNWLSPVFDPTEIFKYKTYFNTLKVALAITMR